MKTEDIYPLLIRIADALDRIAPIVKQDCDLKMADAYIWQAETERLEPVANVNYMPIELLKGIDRQTEILLENTMRFSKGLPANNALLWGARGTGKSSLVKAVHAEINHSASHRLKLIELHREDIPSLPRLLAILRSASFPSLIFCDDLSFDALDDSYKSLKAVLEGGVEGRPKNVIFYATSNRRHLMAREMIENESSTAIHTSESTEEKVSLSDRFGLWLGFHNCNQNTYFAIIDSYAERFGLKDPSINLEAEAKEWAVTRGSRSGRVAWQYIQDLAGRRGKRINLN